MDVDPYKLFGLTKDFSLDELKAKFKQLAMISHPDKGGSEQLFLLITKCFKSLMEEYNRKVSLKNHHELKKGHDQYLSSQPPSKPQNQHIPRSSRFDVDRFNKVFDENKLETPLDYGYKDWMNSESLPEVDDKPKKPISKSMFNSDRFNNEFESNVQGQQNNKYVVKYKEPEALVLSKKIQYTELGLDKIDDFSGDNITQKKLNFMDYRVAHTTSRIVDPKQVNRTEYKTIGELERDRDNISYNMSDQEYQYYMQKKQKEEMLERRRQQIQMQQDSVALQQFEKMQRLMLKNL